MWRNSDGTDGAMWRKSDGTDDDGVVEGGPGVAGGDGVAWLDAAEDGTESLMVW
jgi:hypothetical protein